MGWNQSHSNQRIHNTYRRCWLLGGVLATVVRLASWKESIPSESTPDELTIGEGANTDDSISEQSFEAELVVGVSYVKVYELLIFVGGTETMELSEPVEWWEDGVDIGATESELGDEKRAGVIDLRLEEGDGSLDEPYGSVWLEELVSLKSWRVDGSVLLSTTFRLNGKIPDLRKPDFIFGMEKLAQRDLLLLEQSHGSTLQSLS